MKKIYLSGRISGLPIETAKALFLEASKQLEGYTIVSPLGAEWLGEGASWREHMIQNIGMLLECDAIYMLSNWRYSEGATLEHHIAHDLGLDILYQW